jgi:adenosylmethionine-8-amino-7-oxononanoate aminotransferase
MRADACSGVFHHPPARHATGAIYVNQIEEERLDAVVTNGAYLEATQRVLQRHGGLWFNDEALTGAGRSRSQSG